MHSVRLERGLEFDMQAVCPSTVESSPGNPDVHRYFPGDVVIAASALSVDGDPADLVADAAGSVLAEYRHLPGYERTSRPTPDLVGATECGYLEFVWQAELGELMRSSVVVMSDGERLAVVHAAVPDRLGASAFRRAESVTLSARLLAEDPTARS